MRNSTFAIGYESGGQVTHTLNGFFPGGTSGVA